MSVQRDLVVTGQPVTQEQLLHDALVMIAQVREGHDHAISQLHQLLRSGGAKLSLETLTATAPSKAIEEVVNAEAIGVVNFSTVPVQIGWGGRSAQQGNGIPVGPRSWMVLPQRVNILDIGADPNDVALLNAPVLVVRFDRPQPLAAGRLDGGLPIGTTVSDANVTGAPIVVGQVLTQIAPAPGIYRVVLTASGDQGANTFAVLYHGTTALGAVLNNSQPKETVFENVPVLPGETLKAVSQKALATGFFGTQIAATRMA